MGEKNQRKPWEQATPAPCLLKALSVFTLSLLLLITLFLLAICQLWGLQNMPGRGPKIFQVEQKERLLFFSLAFSKLSTSVFFQLCTISVLYFLFEPDFLVTCCHIFLLRYVQRIWWYTKAIYPCKWAFKEFPLHVNFTLYGFFSRNSQG